MTLGSNSSGSSGWDTYTECLVLTPAAARLASVDFWGVKQQMGAEQTGTLSLCLLASSPPPSLSLSLLNPKSKQNKHGPYQLRAFSVSQEIANEQNVRKLLSCSDLLVYLLIIIFFLFNELQLQL